MRPFGLGLSADPTCMSELSSLVPWRTTTARVRFGQAQLSSEQQHRSPRCVLIRLGIPSTCPSRAAASGDELRARAGASTEKLDRRAVSSIS